MDDEPRKRLAHANCSFVTSQVQMCEDKVGPGTTRVPLYLNHPITQLACWGPERDKLTRVILKLNGHTFIDKSREVLEYEQQELMQVLCKAWVLFLSDKDYYERHHCGVNMSRIDNVKLILHTSQEVTTDLHVLGVNLNTVQISSGMLGMKFAN